METSFFFLEKLISTIGFTDVSTGDSTKSTSGEIIYRERRTHKQKRTEISAVQTFFYPVIFIYRLYNKGCTVTVRENIQKDFLLTKIAIFFNNWWCTVLLQCNFVQIQVYV